MPFDWVEFLALARDLQGCSGQSYSEQAASRSSVSRAYYAAFCHTRNYAERNLGFKRTRTGRDHRSLRDHLRNLGQPWDEIAEDLEDLQKWRNMCDYDDVVLNLKYIVQDALKTAEKVIKDCS
ncbi:MAG: HEPN domain-containing protein [Methanothrix sp.]|uniref:HEPN domain-containing protein n=1 Tax=Methanothrix sp. TaxID=90426 RepID=UPI0032AF7748|nr:HEPN domain-containing protein [Methanothrix sp.]